MSGRKFEQFLPQVQGIVEKVATEYGREFHTYGADRADFEQEMYLYLIEHEDRVAGWLEDRELRDASRFIAKVLRNECKDYGRDVKAQALGFERQDEYFYSPGEVRYLLDAMFDKRKWLEPPESDGRSTKKPAEGNNWVTTLADVAQAYALLNEADQLLLSEFHKDGIANMFMAELYDVSPQVMSARHDAAVKRLVRKLGDESPRPARAADKYDPFRGRHAISNSQARAMADDETATPPVWGWPKWGERV
jgi:hypothetical protein